MKKIRMLPAFVTLLAGAIASISLYVTNQDLVTTLLVLFIVLFVFYFVGVLAMKIIIDHFDKEEYRKTNRNQVQGLFKRQMI